MHTIQVQKLIEMKYGMDEHPIGREAATRLLGAMLASEPSENEYGVNNTLVTKWAGNHQLTMNPERDAELLARITMGSLERCMPYEDITAEAVLRMSGPLVDSLLDVEKNSQSFIEAYLSRRYANDYGYREPVNGMTITTTEILSANSFLLTQKEAYVLKYALNVEQPDNMDEIISGSIPISICIDENWAFSEEAWAEMTYPGPDVYSGEASSTYQNIPETLQVVQRRE